MSRPRRWLFWAHLASGALTGLLILFFAITGSLLTYQRQFLARADDNYIIHPGSSRLPFEELLRRAPFQVAAITLLARPDAPVELTAGRRDLYMMNPYTGEVLGPASPRIRGFFATVTSLHRWFGLENNHRAAASAVKAAASLVFLFLLLSGAVLWFPGKFSGSALRTRSRFTRRTSWRARAWNWHHVAGLWTGLPLLVIVLTGIIMAYPWANAMLFRLAGTPPPPQRTTSESARRAAASMRDKGLRQEEHVVDLDRAFAAVAKEHPAWRTITLRMSDHSSKDALAFSVDEGDGGRPDLKTQVSVTFTQHSQLQLKQTAFQQQPTGQRWRAWIRFTHTGEAAGWQGETLALFSALGACLLSLTGLQMFWQRLLATYMRRKSNEA